MLFLNTVILINAELDDFSLLSEKVELKCSLIEQTVTLWPCLSSTKLVDFMFPDSSIVQCGAEAHFPPDGP